VYEVGGGWSAKIGEPVNALTRSSDDAFTVITNTVAQTNRTSPTTSTNLIERFI
jgi:hypothetical protein